MKVALIGSAGSVHKAPYEDKSFVEFREGLPMWPLPEFVGDDWEIWACSPGAAGALRRCTRFFEVHRWEPGQPWFSQGYCDFLRMFRGPVYVGGEIPKEDIPNQVLYPLESVEAEFSSYFLNSSLSLMAALAIMEIEEKRRAAHEEHKDYDESDDVIGLWGVDMAATEEWAQQKPGCHFFILEALRRGIGVYVPPESCLLRPAPVYGLSEWQHNYIKLTQRSRELNAKIQAASQELEKNKAIIASASGALEDLTYMTNTWVSPYGLPPGQVIRLKSDAQLRQSQKRLELPKQAPDETRAMKTTIPARLRGNGRDTQDDRPLRRD